MDVTTVHHKEVNKKLVCGDDLVISVDKILGRRYQYYQIKIKAGGRWKGGHAGDLRDTRQYLNQIKKSCEKAITQLEALKDA